MGRVPRGRLRFGAYGGTCGRFGRFDELRPAKHGDASLRQASQDRSRGVDQDVEDRMRIAVIAATLVGLAGAFASGGALAQAPNLYTECRQQAITRGLGGEAYGNFMDTCMAQPRMPRTAAEDRFAVCQSQARARAGSGEAYGRALDQCMRSAAAGEPAAPGKDYAECRSEAAGRSLSGDMLSKFLLECITR
jgi:hypothetical protein